MHAVDTNVLVRLIVRDDERQVEAARGFLEKGVWVSTLVLAETIWVLQAVYKQSARDAAVVVEMLFNNPQLSLQDRDWPRRLRSFAHVRRWDFPTASSWS